ncbi:MAG: DUF2947 domain-containing protein, partial [Oscillospiraceae bacterium]|nr:DUF2947 domain-containing protein [Oscillospiraceae bacterium]
MMDYAYIFASIKDMPYRWIFDDPKVSDTDLNQILPLTKECAAQLWAKFISGQQQHLALHFTKVITENEQHWVRSLERLDYNWEDDWNANDMDSLGAFLNSCFDVPQNESVLFFWHQQSAVKTKWGVFMRNWINFLYEDEAPVLFIESQNLVIVFRPMGI